MNEKRLSVLTNSIAYAIHSVDGRPIRKIEGVDSVDISDEEFAKVTRIARHVLAQLDEFDATTPYAGEPL